MKLHSATVTGAKKGYTPASVTSSVEGGKAQGAKVSTKLRSDTAQDPQLTAYMKGLERLKARLSKTNI